MAPARRSAFKMAAAQSTWAAVLWTLFLCMTVQGVEIKEESGVLVLTDANFKEGSQG
jgi:hypothetical protein